MSSTSRAEVEQAEQSGTSGLILLAPIYILFPLIMKLMGESPWGWMLTLMPIGITIVSVLFTMLLGGIPEEDINAFSVGMSTVKILFPTLLLIILTLVFLSDFMTAGAIVYMWMLSATVPVITVMSQRFQAKTQKGALD